MHKAICKKPSVTGRFFHAKNKILLIYLWGYV
uniref:Uncharacterized protein n=1 Tax=Myoviridae sp. ctPJU6 TaxID=2827684 RepID=A0A8S5TKJ9_9CAUD|nr:MAG TPA: hypothetical protein [Myoviridae sp. ctPJU6]